MILPDINLLLYAYDAAAAHHEQARVWWQDALNGNVVVGLPWACMLGFIRLTTSPRVQSAHASVEDACARVERWLARSNVVVLDPGPRHAAIVFSLLRAVRTAGNLTSDAHLAALAIEHQAELHSTDADFSRFPGLRWRNPLRPRR